MFGAYACMAYKLQDAAFKKRNLSQTFCKDFQIHNLVLEGLGKNLKQTKVDLIRP